jgi:hypothetical protein
MTAPAAAPSVTAIDGVADAAPSEPPRQRRWRRILGVVACALIAAAVGLGAIVRHEPAFYRERIAPAVAMTPATEQAARRLVSDMAALHAAIGRVGRWEAALDERDINAWLAVDLPRNHAAILPPSATEPRMRISPGRLDVAIRLGAAGLSTVAWATVDLRLRGPNQLALEIVDAGLGGLPLPRGPVLAECRRRLAGAGFTTSAVRLDGRSVLVVYIPEASMVGESARVLEALSLGEGTIAFMGRTIDDARPDAGGATP